MLLAELLYSVSSLAVPRSFQFYPICIFVEQGMEDEVVPPSMTDYIARVLPQATVHKLPNEGHFSYFFFCDECHRQIFSYLFGAPQGPLETRAAEQLVDPVDPITE